MVDVVDFPGVTTIDSTPEEVLTLAKDWGMVHCIVVGWSENGELRFGGSTCNTADIVLLLERAKHQSMLMLEEE